MKASQIKLNDLKTLEDHDDAIDNIERDYKNIIGGYNAWASGRQTYLTKSAEAKIEAINARVEKLFPGIE